MQQETEKPLKILTNNFFLEITDTKLFGNIAQNVLYHTKKCSVT